jgi:hypothetical protein
MIPPHLQSRTPTKRATAPVGTKLDKNLLAYTAAASAAGVGMLAMAQPAQGKVMYTPGNIPIVQNGALLALDLNNDGTADFEFKNFYYVTHGLGGASLKIAPAQQANEIWGVQSHGKSCATALPVRTKVGSKGNFGPSPNGVFMAGVNLGNSTHTGFAYCPWDGVETAYLGLKFVVNGETHYGWARVKFVAPSFFNSATLSGYAYETVPNRPIVTGQTTGTDETSIGDEVLPARVSLSAPAPAGLGVLATGAAGLERRRKQPNVE